MCWDGIGFRQVPSACKCCGARTGKLVLSQSGKRKLLAYRREMGRII